MELLKFFNRNFEINPEQHIWLVSGPSSCGKSTFLLHERSQEISGLEADAPVLMAGAFGKRKMEKDFFIHYNTLWPAYRKIDMYDFDHEKTWQRLLKARDNLTAVVIKTSRKSIINRILKRDEIEREDLKGKPEKKYDRSKWLGIYDQVKMKKLYKSWIRQLEKYNIPYIVLDGNTEEFKVLENHLENGGNQ